MSPSIRVYLIASFFSISAWGVYGGGSLPPALRGPAHVVRIEAEYLCSSVVLNSTTLLTAAHCTEGMEESLKIINPDTGGKMKNRIRRLDRHPNYRLGFVENPTIDSIYADIALIHLVAPISFPHAGVDLATGWDVHNLSSLSIWLMANGATAKSATSQNLGIPVSIGLHSYEVLEVQSLKSLAGPCENDSGEGILFWTPIKFA